MAADVVEFLRNRFSRSLVEAKSELSGSGPANLLSFLGEIEHTVTQKQINPRADFTALIRTLTKLNDALSECRTFLANHVGKELNWAVMTNCYFIQKIKKRLSALEREFATLVENPYTPEAAAGERKEEAAASGRKLEEEEEEEWDTREFDYEFVETILDALFTKFADEDIGVTVIGIVGMAGTGKTTLVQKLLESKNRVKHHFSPIIQVCMSDVIKDKQAGVGNGMEEETRIVKHILEKLDNSKVDQEEKSGISDGAELESLLQRLHEHLLGERYIIVLDDVWDIKPFYSDLAGTRRRGIEQTEEHDDQCPRLTQGLPKGKGRRRGAVIFTTRIPEVVHHMASKDDTIIKLTMKEYSLKGKASAVLDRWERESFVVRAYEDMMNEIIHRCQGLPLAAKIFADTIPLKIYASRRVLKELYLPNAGAQEPPECPVLVLIDVKNLFIGVRLFDDFRCRLDAQQVYAVLENDSVSVSKRVKATNSKSVLIKFYSRAEYFCNKGDRLAYEIRKRMRIIIVGGDAMANKIFRTLSDLKLPESPAIVVIAPQGTENNIAISFGWEELKDDRQSVTSFLEQVIRAKPMTIDSWHILIEMKDAQSLTAYQQRQTSLLPLPHVDEREEPKVGTELSSFFFLYSFFFLSLFHFVLPIFTSKSCF